MMYDILLCNQSFWRVQNRKGNSTMFLKSDYHDLMPPFPEYGDAAAEKWGSQSPSELFRRPFAVMVFCCWPCCFSR